MTGFREIDQFPVDGKVIQAVCYAETPVVGFMFRRHWASYIPATSGVAADYADFDNFDNCRSCKSWVSTGEEMIT